MDKIKEIEGVDKVSRYISIKTNEDKENDVVAVTITTDSEVSGFKVINGEQYDKNALAAIWISDQYANKNNYQYSLPISRRKL